MASPSLSSSEEFDQTLESSDDLFEPLQQQDRQRIRARRLQRQPGPRKQRKARRVVTQAVFHSIVLQANRQNRPTLKEIAESVDLDVSTVKKLL